MKIAINLRYVRKNKIAGGIGRYSLELLKHLLKIDQYNEYYGVLDHEVEIPFKSSNLYKVIVTPKTRTMLSYLPWMMVSVPIMNFRKRIDIFFSTDIFSPLFKNHKKIIVIHDLAFLKYPEHVYKAYYQIFKFFLPKSIKSSSKIITVSQNSKSDILNYFDVPEEKIQVTYLGVGEEFHPNYNLAAVKRIKNKYNTSDKFILYVGTLEPRKNLAMLIKAYAQLKTKKKIEEKLVLVGLRGWKIQPVLELLKKLNINQDTVITGYIPVNELPLIYNAAQFFVYPSLYEGFGIPPLEAMASGLPVITSNVSSLPEVVGDAAVLFNPHDLDGLVASIETLSNNPEMRTILADKGLKRAKLFNWDNTALETLKVINELA